MKSQTGTVQTGLFGLMLPNKDSKRYLSKIEKKIYWNLRTAFQPELHIFANAQTKIKQNKNSRKRETITEIKTAGIFILLLYTGNKLFIKSQFLLKNAE